MQFLHQIHQNPFMTAITANATMSCFISSFLPGYPVVFDRKNLIKEVQPKLMTAATSR
jgi:hypothetical protein